METSTLNAARHTAKDMVRASGYRFESCGPVMASVAVEAALLELGWAERVGLGGTLVLTRKGYAAACEMLG